MKRPTNLAELVDALEHARQLVRISAEVEPGRGLVEAVTKATLDARRAVLVERVRGHYLPVIANLWSAESHVALASGGTSLVDATQRVADFVAGRPPATSWLRGLVKSAATENPRQPRVVSRAPAQQIVKLASDVDLAMLPLERAALRLTADTPQFEPTSAAVTSAEQSLAEVSTLAGGLLVTTSGNSVIAVELATAIVIGPRQLAIVLQPGDVARKNLALHKRRRATMAVALVLGGDPVLSVLATAQRWLGNSAYELAAVVTGQPLDVATGRTVNLQVPASAELIIEGTIVTDTPPVVVGPYRTVWGNMAQAHEAVVMEVTAVTERTSPLLPLMLPTTDGYEMFTLARCALELLRPVACRLAAGLSRVTLLAAGGSRHLAVASIEKQSAEHPREVARTLVENGVLPGCRWIVIVDDAVNPDDAAAVWHAVAQNADPARDLATANREFDHWDLRAEGANRARWSLIDATRK